MPDSVGHSCDEVALPILRIAYKAKLPPSSSGVALYSKVFLEVLGRLGAPRLLPAPAEPAETQSLRSAGAGLVQGWRLSSETADAVHVELSGRALHELYFTLGLALRGRVPYLITCHDAPSIAGAPLLFRALDRRGLRRLGMWLSNYLGRRIEHLVLARAAGVLTLTEAGAEAITSTYDVGCRSIPHVVASAAPVAVKDRIVFVPGYVDDAAGIAGLVEALSSSDAGGCAAQWHIRVGASPATVRAEVERLCGAPPDRLTWLGYLDEKALLAEYARAAFVARICQGPWANTHAASGPLAWAVSAGCVTITNDSRSGAVELERAGLLRRTDDVPAAVAIGVAAWTPSAAADLASRAQGLLGIDEVGRQYEEVMRIAVKRVRQAPITGNPNPPNA